MLSIPRPRLNRVEYRLVVTDRTGDTEVICDPDNPDRVRTAFGERSVALMPGYERPSWLQDPVPRGSTIELVHPEPPRRAADRLVVPAWVDSTQEGSTAGRQRRSRVRRSRWADHVRGEPDHPRGACAVPDRPDAAGQRDEWYAANPDYLTATVGAVESVAATVPISERRW